MRVTEQRRRILERLRETTAHPTAAELYETVRRDLPRISLATVYRNLKMLVGHGQALQLDSGLGPSRFDGDTRLHSHATCVQCARVSDVDVGPVTGIRPRVRKGHDFNILGHRLEFFGVCGECRRKAGPKRTRKHT